MKVIVRTMDTEGRKDAKQTKHNIFKQNFIEFVCTLNTSWNVNFQIFNPVSIY